MIGRARFATGETCRDLGVSTMETPKKRSEMSVDDEEDPDRANVQRYGAQRARPVDGESEIENDAERHGNTLSILKEKTVLILRAQVLDGAFDEIRVTNTTS